MRSGYLSTHTDLHAANPSRALELRQFLSEILYFAWEVRYPPLIHKVPEILVYGSKFLHVLCLCLFVVFSSVFLYACESWTLTAERQRRIRAMEMRCYRKILCISQKDRVTNEEVFAEMQQAIGPHEDLLTIVKRRKLNWYGHVSHSSGLAKPILQGAVKGGRRQRRPKKRLEDNIREGTGLEFAKSQRAVENREEWRKLVVKPSVVPQGPLRLRDR